MHILGLFLAGPGQFLIKPSESACLRPGIRGTSINALFPGKWRIRQKGRRVMENNGHVHTHVDEEGREYTHSHLDGSVHKHTHENTKAVLNRLSRASGHLESVKRMIEDGKDCSEVLIQLSAVIAALNNTGKVILQDHISHCIVDAIESGDTKAVENLNRAIDRFIK